MAAASRPMWPAQTPPAEPSPDTLRRARWLVGAWLLMCLAGLVALSLATPLDAVCRA